MKIDRLLEIILVLFKEEHITAKKLADRFDVSVRTIYRDIDSLSLAGIPVYSSKGSGGGIGLMKSYVLDKSILSENEQKEIVFALQSLSATKYPGIEGPLDKISSLFKNVSNEDWLEVDFSYWGSDNAEKTKYKIIKEGILSKHVISFDYANSNMEKSSRDIEPFKLIFKSHSWYVYGFCKIKNNFRLFKISRMNNVKLKDEVFVRKLSEHVIKPNEPTSINMVNFKMKFKEIASYRVYDDFSKNNITLNDDNTILVNITFPYDEWIISYILSFGSFVEVLEPKYVRDEILKRASEIVKSYE